MKVAFIFIFSLIAVLGCARVRVEAPKDPIKVDISMRLDIYQHIEKDIDAVENIVSGSKEKTKPKDNSSFLEYFSDSAYAQEGLDPQVEQAALRRKDRYAQLVSFESKGLIGENRFGLTEVKAQSADASLSSLVNAENNDRMVIYQSIAKKNKSTVEEVQEIYARRLQKDAQSGTPIEVQNASGQYEWLVK